jgi:phage FluMu protein Com
MQKCPECGKALRKHDFGWEVVGWCPRCKEWRPWVIPGKEKPRKTLVEAMGGV